MRWHRLPLLVLLVAVVPGLAITAAPARAGGAPDARVETSVAADEGGIYVAAYAVITGDDRSYAQDAALVALDPTTGAERWRFVVGARFMTPPVLADGLAFVHVIGDGGKKTGTLYAVEATTGQERWRFGAGAPYSPPVVAGDVVYAAGDGHLYALDTASGTERWRRPDVPPLASKLAIDRDTVYAAIFGDCTTWRLVAFDAATGAERSSWSIESPGLCAIAGPAVADGVVYVVGSPGEGGPGDGYLAALDAATGTERWRWEFDSGGRAVTPVVNAGTVYVNGLDTLHAVDAAGGAERWRFGAGGVVPPTVAADGAVFVHAGAGAQTALYAIDDATGTERWRFRKAAPAFSEFSPAVAVAEGVAYAGGGETIYAVDAASGAERWRSRLALALPAVTPAGDASPAAGP